MVSFSRVKVSRHLTQNVATRKDSVKSRLRQSNTFYLLRSASPSLVFCSTFHLFRRVCFQLADIKFRSVHVRHPFRRQCIRNCESGTLCLSLFSGLVSDRHLDEGWSYFVERATKPSKDLMSGTYATFFFPDQETFCRSNFPKRQILIEPYIFSVEIPSDFLQNFTDCQGTNIFSIKQFIHKIESNKYLKKIIYSDF